MVKENLEKMIKVKAGKRSVEYTLIHHGHVEGLGEQGCVVFSRKVDD